MNYTQALKIVQNEAVLATGKRRVELEVADVEITAQLLRSMPNVQRILLCEDRASIRKALAALSE